MTPLVPAALFGWVVVGPLLCALLGGRRGVIWTYLLGWMFLPIASYVVEGLPDYTKASAVSLSALLGVALFDVDRLLSLRPRWIDLPMAAWCAVPFLSSISNGLGAFDGISASLEQVVYWGLPYLFGRLYLDGSEGLRELAVALVLGGIIYTPLCLYEVRMSPQLHTMVYGFHQHSFIQTRRFGGWRPTVFMQHGLAVALFMSASAVVAYWLWQTRAVRTLFGIPMALIALGLIVIAILCKSAFAIALMLGFIAVLAATRLSSTRLALATLVLLVPVYPAVRTAGLWSGEGAMTAVRMVLPERASSLQARLNAEEKLIDRALRRPLVGWGGWGRHRVTTDAGSDAARTDGLWVIALGKHGLLGLATLLLATLLPPAMLLRRLPRENIAAPVAAPAVACAVAVVMFAYDSLLNAMLNPMFVLAIGGIAGAVAIARRPRRAAAPATLPAATLGAPSGG